MRRNIHDDDALDTLSMPLSSLHVGKAHATQTADDLLSDRRSAPSKASILAALAAFDPDDDERDDTYDAADAGAGVVPPLVRTNTEDLLDGEEDAAVVEALFRALAADPAALARDPQARRSPARAALRRETGWSDERIEGWAVMLARDPARRRRLEERFGGGAWAAGASGRNAQAGLGRTAWREGDDDGDEDGDGEGGTGGRGGHVRGGRGGRGRGGRDRGGGAGNQPPADSDLARRRKEANKSGRANHNRRDQRARKMARGGL